MAGCGEYHFVQAELQWRALVQVLSTSQHVDNEHGHPKGGPTCWNALGGREVESRLYYILLPATRLQKVTHCFVFRKGRRLQLIPHRRPRVPWPLMIRAKTMVPQHAVTWDFDAIILGLRDPDRRQSLLPRSGEMEFHTRRHHFGNCYAGSD